MKRMIILFALVGITGISGLAFSQGGFKNMTDEQILEKMETRLDKRVARLTEKLGLTPQQVPKIRQALADGQTQIFEIKKAEGDRETKRPQIKAIRKATRTTVESYLSNGQKATFATLKKRGHGKKGHGKKGHGKKRFKKMAKKLDLDDAQKVKMKEIFKGKRGEIKALKESGATKDVIKAKKKELRKASMEEFKTILTPAQLEKLKTFKKNHHGKKGHGKRKFKKMAKQLDLDDAQKVKMKAIFKGKRGEVKALKEAGATQDEIKAKRQEIRKASMKEFKAILTPAQLEKLETFKKNHPRKK